MAFRLNELRRDGKNCFPNKKKISSIRFLDGLNAWSTHYDTIVASIVIPFEEKDGSVTELSAGQAFNRMMGDPDKRFVNVCLQPGRKLGVAKLQF